MLLPLLAAALGASDPVVYHGRQNQTAVAPPRIEAQVVVDGRLDEAAWRDAAVLTGFSQYMPADGRAAADSTEVRVFYSPTAIHFGIRAFEAHGAVRATLADRDRIGADDYVEIVLGTFNDRRQVNVFAVNPYGVQSDGTMIAGNRGRSGMFGTDDPRERPDLSADFVYQSKGRLTPEGYEVEVRIPFKSLRYQSDAVQSWSLNLVRRVQHSGYEDSWFPARQSAASFVAQAGTLDGLRELERGLVLDLTPETTARRIGAVQPTRYARDNQGDVGLNARWGVTNNLTLNATANPDFSQVESDAAQFQFDPRQRIIYSEKRPFFLDNIDQFAAPFRLIHTRNIVQPAGAAKFTGKARGTNLGLLAAVDDRLASSYALDPDEPRPPHPVFAVGRLTRDIGGQSRVGLTYTDKADGDRFNRVAAADARFVLGGIYSLSGTLGGSITDYGDGAVKGPLWSAAASRNGRRVGIRYALDAISEEFDAQMGAISRPGIANLAGNHRVTFFGGQGALVESYAVDVTTAGTWKYRRFVEGRDAIEKKLHFNNNVTLRGGWNAGASILVESFGLDDDLYEGLVYLAPRTGGGVDTVAFTGTPRLSNLDYVLTAATPEWPRFSSNVFYLWGRDENFAEWSSGDILWLTANANWRPTDQMRITGTWQQTDVKRHTDGSLVSRFTSPLVKVEYQVARPIFVRVVGEFTTVQRDTLRDDSRTGRSLYYIGTDGTLSPTLGQRVEGLRSEYLFSYTPNPGTVFYAGYTSRRQGLTRDMYARPDQMALVGDGAFVKMSYLFRM